MSDLISSARESFLVAKQSIDIVSDGGNTDAALQEARNALEDEIIAISVLDMVSKVTARLGQNKMERLRIFGHGAPGLATVGHIGATRSFETREGLSQQWLNATKTLQVVKHISSKSTNYLLLNDPPLNKLASCFAPGGWAELHHCYVAKGEYGRALLVALARTWSVPVKGGEGLQVVGGGMEKCFLTVYPNGEVRRTC